MPTDTQLTGGSCPFRVSGKNFDASPLTDRDYAELDEYVQDQIIQSARRSCKDLSKEERRELLTIAVRASVGVRWNDEEGTRILFNTPVGQSYMFWSMVKHNHKITPKEFEKIFLSSEHFLDNLEEGYRIFDKLNFTQIEEETEEAVETVEKN
jgi:hypothetical protein